MKKFWCIGALCMLLFFLVSFDGFSPSNNNAIKEAYLENLGVFLNDINAFKKVSKTNNPQKLRAQFLKLRNSYKHIELFVEYYYPFFAIKLNGPPIPFFEESDPDIGQQQPHGMQVMEALLFPNYSFGNNKVLLNEIELLAFNANSLLQTQETFSFSEEFIIDALIESMYSISALGITGFDAQASGNGLNETNEVLSSVKDILFKCALETTIPKTLLTGLKNKFDSAQQYLKTNNNFNRFDRMKFIKEYANPITQLIIDYKLSKGYIENLSPAHYSSINKKRVLFNMDGFNQYVFLDDNTTNKDKVILGKKLFLEKMLSADNKHSCGSCHNPNKVFTDGLEKSKAIDGHTSLLRNAPTIWNAALQKNLFSDSRSSSLEDQVLQVLNNSKELHGSAQKAAEKIIELPSYKEIYERAYPATGPKNAAYNICNAIACYERTLIALNSPFDKFMKGQTTISKEAINGFNLFMGKGKCGTCHFAPLFSGAKPPGYYYIESEVIGVPQKNKKGKLVADDDKGRFANTGALMHKYSFKTPGLRNVAETAPYMHNGVFNTLEEVVDFYNKGGGRGIGIDLPNQSLPFDKLNLTSKEKSNIVVFLKTLTDPAVLESTEY